MEEFTVSPLHHASSGTCIIQTHLREGLNRDAGLI